MSMNMRYTNSDSVTINSTDSEALVEVATQIKKLRETSDHSSREHSRALKEIENDPTLSAIGRQERTAELETARREQRRASMQQEKQIINDKITALERRLDGFVGYSEANIMSYRDAQDRAEAITDKDRALTVMTRALRTNDKTLAHALYRRAVDNRWAEARQAFATANPEVARLVNDVHTLQKLHDDSFNRAVAYL